MCLSRERRNLERIAGQVREYPVETAFCELTALDITPKGVDKGSGLSRLRHELGMEEGPLFVAGDGENDLPLMRLAEMSFAPDNAQGAVRQQASVIQDGSKDGLLELMLHHAASFTAGTHCR